MIARESVAAIACALAAGPTAWVPAADAAHDYRAPVVRSCIHVIVNDVLKKSGVNSGIDVR